MKKIVIAALCLMSLVAEAREECVASGDVVIKANNMIEIIKGRIGATPVTLFQYGNNIEGDIEGLKTSLKISETMVEGFAGTNQIRWDFDSNTGFISGYQICLFSGSIR